MLSHEQIWQALDRLASTFGFSPSGLAKQAGLDPTSFNKSKRYSPAGKPRWPSTESISRVLAATGATMLDFVNLVDDDNAGKPVNVVMPLVMSAQTKVDNCFDEQGMPQGQRLDTIQFPASNSESDGDAYALEVSETLAGALYQHGDVLVLSPKSNIRAGDRVVIKTVAGDLIAREVIQKTVERVELCPISSTSESQDLLMTDIQWMARILWVSQ